MYQSQKGRTWFSRKRCQAWRRVVHELRGSFVIPHLSDEFRGIFVHSRQHLLTLTPNWPINSAT